MHYLEKHIRVLPIYMREQQSGLLPPKNSMSERFGQAHQHCITTLGATIFAPTIALRGQQPKKHKIF
jgi:hypothetical protein